MSSLRSRGLIPRYSLPIVHRKAVDDPNNKNKWKGSGDKIYEFTKAIAYTCTLQQPSPDALTPEEQGLSQDEILILRTDTPVYGESEGTSFLGTSIYIPNSWFWDDMSFAPIDKGGWFTITKPHRHGSNVINHYQATLVKDTSAEAGQYPDTEIIKDDVDTRSKFLSGNWGTKWLS